MQGSWPKSQVCWATEDMWLDLGEGRTPTAWALTLLPPRWASALPRSLS